MLSSQESSNFITTKRIGWVQTHWNDLELFILWRKFFKLMWLHHFFYLHVFKLSLFLQSLQYQCRHQVKTKTQSSILRSASLTFRGVCSMFLTSADFSLVKSRHISSLFSETRRLSNPFSLGGNFTKSTLDLFLLPPPSPFFFFPGLVSKIATQELLLWNKSQAVLMWLYKSNGKPSFPRRIIWGVNPYGEFYILRGSLFQCLRVQV